jgi:type IX secretion system PorP/SprF family membrane protein
MNYKFYIYFTFCTSSIVCGQDLHFSNIHSMTQQVFPEIAGLNNDLEASVYYRNQWKAMGAKYGAFGASYASTLQPKHKLNGSHLAGGINFYREQMNKDASHTAARMTLVQHQLISRFSKLSLGLNIGFQSLSFDPANGQWGSQHDGIVYNPNFTSGESFTTTNKTGFDVGSGIVYSLRHKKGAAHLLQVGFSGQHLNRPNMSFYGDRSGYLPIKLVGYTSLNLKIGNRGSYFQPTVLIQKQSKFSSLVFGGLFKMNLQEKAITTSNFSKTDKVLLGFGGYYRSQDAFIACLNIQKTSWNVSLAYDFTVSHLKNYNYSRGGVELQFQYVIPKFQFDHN